MASARPEPHPHRSHRLLAVASTVAVIAALTGAVCGAAVVHYDLAPFRWAKSVVPYDWINYADRIVSSWGGDEGLQDKRFYDSIFLRLEGQSVVLPVSAPGGGLAVLGEKVVVITQDGVFAASSPEDLTKLAVTPPNNGIEAYRRAAESERYATYNHAPERLRYNDIFILPQENRLRFFISFTKYFENEECYRNVVADHTTPRGVIALDEVSIAQSDWTTLYQTEPCLPLKPRYNAIEGHMAGGRIAFDGVDKLYLASGDFHWDGVYAEKAIAQLDDYEYGKVIEINIDTRKSRVISKGHRNMQGIAFVGSGELYVLEHGFRGGDELNRIVEGRDYGFPKETLGTLYNKRPVPNTLSLGRHDVFEPPLFAWLPSVAISSLNPIDGFHAAWDGDLLMATLKDQSLYRLRPTAGGIQFAERIAIGERIRYAIQLNDRLVLWTDSALLIFLEVSDSSFAMDFLAAYFDTTDGESEANARVEAAVMACLECHALDPDDEQTGPSLGNIFQAPVAATGFGAYSDALKEFGGRWTRAKLAQYIVDPKGLVEGTSMPAPGITDPEVVAGVIDFLEALSGAAAGGPGTLESGADLWRANPRERDG